MVVDRLRMEKALELLADTDELIAKAKTDCRRAEYIADRKEAAAFLSLTGNIQERKAGATLDHDVISAYNAHTDALEKYERLAAKRQTEALIIDVWRSLESSRRVGT